MGGTRKYFKGSKALFVIPLLLVFIGCLGIFINKQQSSNLKPESRKINKLPTSPSLSLKKYKDVKATTGTNKPTDKIPIAQQPVVTAPLLTPKAQTQSLKLISETTNTTGWPWDQTFTGNTCKPADSVNKRAVMYMSYGLGKDENGIDIARPFPHGCDFSGGEQTIFELNLAFNCATNGVNNPTYCDFKLGIDGIDLPTTKTYEPNQTIKYIFEVNKHGTYTMFGHRIPANKLIMNL